MTEQDRYGNPLTAQRPTDTRPGPGGVLSGGPIIGGAVALTILLGVVLYGVSKVVNDSENATASEPYTVSQQPHRR